MKFTKAVPPRSSGKGQPYPDYEVNEQGVIKEIDAREVHETDYYASRAERFLRAKETRSGPWFAILAPRSPPAKPLPKPPSFNEDDVSDKPDFLQEYSRLTDEQISEMEELYKNQQRDLRAVDFRERVPLGARGFCSRRGLIAERRTIRRSGPSGTSTSSMRRASASSTT